MAATRLITTLAVVGLLIVLFALRVEPQPLATTYQLSGVVEDQVTGRPIANAKVTLYLQLPGKVLAEARSSHDGSFVLDVPIDSGLLVVDADGYAVYRIGYRRSRWLNDSRVQLQRPSRILGVILDSENGRPIDATVLLISLNSRNAVTRTIRAPAGKFDAGDVLPGNTLVVARGTNRAGNAREISATPGGVTTVTVLLERGSGVAGFVRDQWGRPVRMARVRAQYPTAPQAAQGILESFVRGSVQTDSRGAFDIHDLRPGGPIRLIAETRAGQRGSAELTLQPGQTLTDVDVIVR
jgi:hypothetical protein